MAKKAKGHYKVELPPKLIPVFMGSAFYRGAYGGRGSAKTRSFAKMTAIKAIQFAAAGQSGIILCGREFQNSLDESSMAEVKEAINSEPWLKEQFDIGEKYIRTKCGKVSYSFAGLRHNISSIKSRARILILWVDEAEPVSEYCWQIVIPTVREHNSEIWVTWNPEREGSATDLRFRKNPPKDSKIIELNFKDNPWFKGSRLEQTRKEDLEKRAHQYDHIWEGGYVTAVEGAYLAKHITKAKDEGRIGSEDKPAHVNEDPLMIVRLVADIGGTGAKADNFVFWACQFIGNNINFINHYEVQGQPIGHHLSWLREQGYTISRAKIYLPHDGDTHDRVHNISYASAFEKAGYEVEVVPNQGRGAAMQRVEAMRNNFHRMYFDHKCDAGVKALAWYHEKRDQVRQIGLGPDHDWSSHSFDAAGIAPIIYEEPKAQAKPLKFASEW